MRRAALLCVALACWGGASLSAPAPAPVAPGPAQPAPPGGGAPAAAPAPGTGPAPAPAAAAAPLPRPPSDALFSPDDDDDPLPSEIDDDEDQDTNATERGMFLGAPCEFTCNSKLHHVFCDPITGHCECEKKYPVRLGANKGCAKPKGLGEQCFYRQACKYMDAHASCIQINHNAICQCESGFHSVSYSKPVRKVFCTEDMALLTSDVHTLLGVCSGIAILAGLLCLVLHLYTRGRLPHNVQAGHYADASLSPPMLFSSETGIPLCVQDMQGQGQCGGPYQGPGHGPGRTGSRSSLRSAGRRASPSPLGAPSRAGSRRPSLTSLQSSSSSVRSFSMRRFEREREQKERRQQMQMRLAQLQGGVGLGALSGGEGGPSGGRGAPSPSPRTPNSTDGLLPAVNETRELSLSQFPLMDECESPSMDGIIGPCSSSGTSY